MKHLLFSSLLLFCIIFPAISQAPTKLALTQAEREWIIDNPVVKLGSDPAWAPFEWVEGDKQFGVAADYAELIEEMTGLDIQIVPNLTWPQVVEGLQNETIDMATALYYNPDRDSFLTLTPPYTSWYQVFMIRKGTKLPENVNTSSFKVGVGDGYSLHGHFQRTYPNMTIVPFSSPGEGLLALATGEIDAYAGNLAVLSYQQQFHNLSNIEIAGKVEGLDKDGLCMGVRKDLPMLLSILTKALYAITEEQRISISQKWFGGEIVISLPEESNNLTEEEKRFLENIEVLHVGLDPSWAPVEYFDSNGEVAGITSDNLRILSDTLGIRFNVAKGVNWVEVLEKMKAKEIDVITSITPSEERSQYMLFTRPHLKLPMVIVMRDDAQFIDGMESLAGMKIAIVKGYIIQTYLEQDYPDYTVLEFNNMTEAMKAVADGKADAVIGTIAIINLIKNEHNLPMLQVAATTPYSYDLCFGVRKDMPELVQILEKGLSSITPREKAILIEKWTNIQYKSVIDWKVITIISLIIVIIAAIFIIRSVRESFSQRRLLSSTIDSMSDAVLVLNDQYQVIRSNSIACDLSKALLGEGEPESILTSHFESNDQTTDSLINILKTHENLMQNVQVHLSHDELKFWFSISASPLVFKKGKLGVVLIIRDISKQIQRDRQLEQSRKMDAVGQLASGVAHDFNNMLGAIIGFTELLLESAREDQIEMLTHVLNASEKASGLTKQLLLFSRKSPKASTAIDIHSVINEVAFLLSRTIDRKITIETELNSPLSRVVGDDSQLQNAFMNIGINASHAMPEGGSLMFKSSTAELDTFFCENSTFDITPGEYILVEIIDTGTGMTEEVKKRIFEPFFTTKGVGKGTGLGLSAVYTMVEKHHGAINIYSEVGKGTSFHIYLPFCGADGTEEKKVPTELIRGTGRILVVDDEEFIRITVTAMLRSLGYDIVTVDNGQEALKLLKSESFNLIILDMIMPVMNGRETFEKIIEMGISTPIVLSSGFSKEDDVEYMKQQGLFGFLHKPYQRMELSQMVARAIGDAVTTI